MRISDWSSDVCSSDLLRACEPCRQRPGRMGASVIAVDNGDIFGPQEAYLWPYVSKDAQYGACIDTHVKGRLGPVEGLFDLNPVLPEQCRDRAVGTLRKDKRAITTAIQITDEAQNRKDRKSTRLNSSH